MIPRTLSYFWIFVTLVASATAWLTFGNWKIGAIVLISTAFINYFFSWKRKTMVAVPIISDDPFSYVLSSTHKDTCCTKKERN